MVSTVHTPARIEIAPSGEMTGSTRVYRKHLGDMTAVYRDTAAHEAALREHGPDHVVYEVAEHRYGDEPGSLIVGTSTLQPGRYGHEFAVTRGHLHGIADRAELYHCIGGHGVMLLETLDGRSEAVELRAGQAVDVPGHWIHRSVNVGDEPFVTLFCYAADAGQDYSVISDAHGMRDLVIADEDAGWRTVTNPAHTGYRP
ncbi:glucose-6-phosphate isomerase family protein [Frigoribacterium sp. PhB24]|uniref:glucose-6-phosphate isomerase family protein n=1 Tax=Frigoribacterium sp. PhB24 TaxID=2485204 RepID=UPI000F474E91|nr:glucose-6-phosphate isomerase family protein [Frigoribacterium sp. PhB24]ROS48857.1 glucose-6-phosphate isomerase [Frigoribacterium sp. PhB24]